MQKGFLQYLERDPVDTVSELLELSPHFLRLVVQLQLSQRLAAQTVIDWKAICCGATTFQIPKTHAACDGNGSSDEDKREARRAK